MCWGEFRYRSNRGITSLNGGLFSLVECGLENREILLGNAVPADHVFASRLQPVAQVDIFAQAESVCQAALEQSQVELIVLGNELVDFRSPKPTQIYAR